jgi:chemotaxis protein MotB
MRAHSRTFRNASRSALALAAGLAAALLIGCVSTSTYEAALKERDALARQNNELTLERSRLEERVQGLEGRTRSLEEELAMETSQADELRMTYDSMVEKLESELASGHVHIQQLRDGLSVNLSEGILFDTASAELRASGRDVLQRVAGDLEKSGYQIAVQGHTDNVPISSQRYPSNWELAAARSAQVVRLLEQSGVSSQRLTSESHGEHRPVASNDEPEGRAQNRRIEIRLRPLEVPAGDGDLPALVAPPAEDEELPASIEPGADEMEMPVGVDPLAEDEEVPVAPEP